MCNPTAMAVTQLVGTGIRMYGQLSAANAASNQADFNAQVAANNAAIANENADAALDKGEADKRDQRRETRQRIGLQKAQLAAAGFGVSGGSSIDILGDTAALGELDVLRIGVDADNRATNFRNQSSNFSESASFGRKSSSNRKKAGFINAGSTLITGASRAGSSFLATKP